ncbi:unnamed protein product, partial [Closterium sp. NIES-65]
MRDMLGHFTMLKPRFTVLHRTPQRVVMSHGIACFILSGRALTSSVTTSNHPRLSLHPVAYVPSPPASPLLHPIAGISVTTLLQVLSLRHWATLQIYGA